MDIVFVLLTLVITKLVVVAPAVLVWRFASPPASGGASWRRALLALLGPLIVAFVLVVLVGLPAYTGECGGWLGETTPCSGFGQFVTETMHWTAMILAVPGLLGIALGVAVLIFRTVRHRMSDPKS